MARNLRSFLLIVIGTCAVLGLAGGRASAQDEDIVIKAQVKDQVEEGGETTRVPVPGVTITVFNEAGDEVVSAVTDEQGVALLDVGARATYIVRLDEDSLPEGKEIASNSAAEVTLTEDSFTTATRTVNFFTGERVQSTTSGLEKLAQRLVDGARLGLILALCSVGLSLIFGTTGLTNFAHGELVTLGGMTAFRLNVTGIGFLSFLPLVDSGGQVNLLLAAPFVVLVGGGFGLLLDWLIFGRLRKRGIGLVSQLVVSVGLSILLRNAYLWQFGGRTKPLRDYSLQTARKYGPVSITNRDLTTAIISLIVLVLVALALQRTRLGKATRAVSDNPDLASATGIDTQKVIRIVWFASGALAALGGLFRGLDEQVGFEMGTGLLFLMFAGITLGGLGSAFGALVGGFVIGLFVELAALKVPTELKNAPALLILILVLLIRPQGILGRRQRVG